MTKPKKAKNNNTVSWEADRQSALPRPENPNIGQVIIERNQRLIYTGRDCWTWFPETAEELILFARRHGWGSKVEISGHHEFAGFNFEGDKTFHTHAKIVVHLGREAGLTKNGKTSKGYAYRLVWTSERTGLFELVRWHRRTTTANYWHEFGTVGEVRAIIALNPVIRRIVRHAETATDPEADTTSADADDRSTVAVGKDDV